MVRKVIGLQRRNYNNKPLNQREEESYANQSMRRHNKRYFSVCASNWPQSITTPI